MIFGPAEAGKVNSQLREAKGIPTHVRSTVPLVISIVGRVGQACRYLTLGLYMAKPPEEQQNVLQVLLGEDVIL